jgi:glucose-1-phosphate cytidylyltransferase
MRSALILCGGRATRMGSRAAHLPKALLSVHGKPILWYIVGRLYRAGIRHFIFPIGHRGQDIVEWIGKLSAPDCKFEAIDTGANTEVGRRLAMVRHLLPDNESFMLANGDALFDFDIERMIAEHEAGGHLATLATSPVISQFGLLIESGGRIMDFSRDSHIQSISTSEHGETTTGYVYAGIAALRTDALDSEDIENALDFEIELFRGMIGRNSLRRFAIKGYWHAIDTPKDLDLINASIGWRATGARHLRATLEGFGEAEK